MNVDLKEVQPPDILYHGTATRFVPSILEEGILRCAGHGTDSVGDSPTTGSYRQV